MNSQQPRDDRDFTIVALPDTQMYSDRYPEIFRAQTEWIVSQAPVMNIRMVWHLGDLVRFGSEDAQAWENAAAAIGILDRAGIPCIIAIGNHDYDSQLKVDRSAEFFNRYFGMHRYEGRPWFGGAFERDRSENVYAVFEAGGERYLHLLLEFGPRKAVVAWADDVIRTHADRHVFIVTHGFLHYHDGRTGPGDEWNPHNYPGTANDTHDGEDLWRVLVSRHANIRWVHNGHILKGGQGLRSDAGIHGNTVHQVASNYQTYENGGDGWLRILHVKPSQGVVVSVTYSPYRGEYLRDGARHAYTLPWGNRR